MEYMIHKKNQEVKKKIEHNKTKMAVLISTMAVLCATSVVGCGTKTKDVSTENKNKSSYVGTIDESKLHKKEKDDLKDTKAEVKTEEKTQEDKENKAKETKNTPKATTTSATKTKASGGSKPQAHTHNFKPVYGTERVMVQGAYDEPQYSSREVMICNGHGLKFYDSSSLRQHREEVGGCGFHTTTEQYQTGTIHHDAVYQDKQVVKGYKCDCGVTK